MLRRPRRSRKSRCTGSTAVDSNGAGDMFAGAFLYAITRGEDFASAGRFASLAAGNIVARYGPRLAPDYAALRREFFGD